MDDLREFEELAESFDMMAVHFRSFLDGSSLAYESAAKSARQAIKEWRKRHQQENSCLSVEVCSPSEILPIECGFGEKE